jgi:hypothetical protein
VDNIKVDLTDIRWDGTDWIALAQDRDQWRALVNMVINMQDLFKVFLGNASADMFLRLRNSKESTVFCAMLSCTALVAMRR